ncbi:CDP-alcohol phosphatidyltransferase family protein [Kordiimonas aquimaris]|uniref:CDP-alcohol phosphatidyltransferase family protein n=1 Tax=Kordiimonas aquimaris TaxID=707591 RepID=UPI0021D15599|nr:phosphatidylcholine/phosphatidylserine synthase [Kordiimonas aquimaris]
MGDKKKTTSIRAISIRTILPNVVTLCAFMAGVTSMRFAFAEKWELAATAIAVAGILDGLDGTVARLLKSTSKFGAELDSLSDVVSFGVAPAVVVYLWSLQSLDRFGWAVALIYATAMALRLARFNARLEDQDEPRKRLGFLTGVPAPMGAALLLTPMMIDLALNDGLMRSHSLWVSIYTIVIALLIVSTIPTISLKALRVPRTAFVPVMLVIGIVLAGLFVRTWAVLALISALYIAFLPVNMWAFRKRLAVKGVKNK